MSNETSTAIDFKDEMDRASLLIPFAMAVPVTELMQVIVHAHTLGPILDPTAYRGGMKKLEQSQAVLNAFAAFQREIQKCPAIVQALANRAAADARD